MPAEIAQQVKIARQDHPDVRIGILLHPKVMPEKEFLQGDIVIDSWNAVKGMEFDAVIIASADEVLSSEDKDEDFKEKFGLYVAMTRAKDHLVILYDIQTDVVKQIEYALNSEDCLASD